MNVIKLYSKYINLVSSKYYLLAFMYLFINIIFVYFNINISDTIFLMKLENINLFEVMFYILINGLVILLIQSFIKKILLKSNFLRLFTLVFIFQLFIIYIKLILDLIFFAYSRVDFVYYYNLMLTYV